MAAEVARHFNIHSKEVLVCSTGRIGEPLPMSRITAGIRDAADDIIQEYDGAKAFQEAILTSDTVQIMLYQNIRNRGRDHRGWGGQRSK